MAIILSRIDDRLIHGQVVEGWLNVVGVDTIVVVSDEVASDSMQQALLSLAVPSNILLEMLSVKDTSKSILDGKYQDRRVMLLFSNPFDVVSLLKLNVKLDSVNVGGMHYYTNKIQILKYMSVDSNDIAALKEISSLGTVVEGRILPNDTKADIIEIINKFQERTPVINEKT